MQTIAQAFHDFLVSLELTAKQTENASNQHIHLRTQLQKRLEVVDNFLSGSYARNTAVRPLNDIDVFLVLGNGYANYTPKQLLTLVKDVLETIYPGKTSTPQARSVNIEFTVTGIAYDVVPALVAGKDVYRIPAGDASGWIQTNPKEHARRSTAANEAAGKKLKPLLKAIKHAKNYHQASARSFHLEVMSWSILTRAPDSYLEGLDILLRGLAERVCNACPDPAGLGPDIQPSLARCLEAKQWLDKMAALARDARRLATDGRLGEAHAKLRELFGPQWPEQGTPDGTRTTTSFIGGRAVDGPGSRFG
jgi:hypothetical protein